LRLAAGASVLEQLLFSRRANHDNCRAVSFIDLVLVRAKQHLERE